ncbi:hypothetical protein [Bradyrhizobium sp. NP1]|uniref:hypothetical protein n=1 Tax=Bradyrhizobium sp. NP1 TaxID=3049772 RepID=UPI0025A56491|nr:hypothetical protein [Bradyrhizobium sp. NP1]WJR76810.1 hypothetical protein QOU61_29230 [Bradyrhizobium sp. NP1]
MIAIIAVLCSLSSPANCHEQTVTTSDFVDVSMQSCLMGAPQLADWMNQHPTERLATRPPLSWSSPQGGHIAIGGGMRQIQRARDLLSHLSCSSEST